MSRNETTYSIADLRHAAERGGALDIVRACDAAESGDPRALARVQRLIRVAEDAANYRWRR